LKRIFGRLVGVLLAFTLIAPFMTESIYATVDGNNTTTEATETTNTEGQADEDLPAFVEPEYVSQFTFPDEMRAITLTPTVDFAEKIAVAIEDDDDTAEETEETEDTEDTDDETDEETPSDDKVYEYVLPSNEEISAELDGIMQNAISLGMNTVIIKTSYNGEGFYSADINETVEKTPVELAIKAAKDNGMFAYLVFDINYVLNQMEDRELQERIDYLAIKAHTFTVKNRVDGILLDGYYSSKNTVSLNDYMSDGSGIGFDNWLLDNGAYVFSLVSDAIRKTNNTVPVGIYLSDVWSNYTTNEKGSQTSGQFEALKDGYSDTLAYIQYGYADFIMLETEGAIADDSLPFAELVRWWANYAVLEELPFFVMHNNQKVYTSEQGWGSPDQVVQQLLLARDVKGYCGSAFLSYASLAENIEESTDLLVKYYDNTINLETIDNELNIVSPTSTKFTTEEPTVAFMGSFDPNFTVYFNGKEIKLNDAGNFYYEVDLDVGLNTFTIKNKGKTTTYNITRKVTVLKNVEPAGSMEIEGSTNITIRAIAYKGSYVTASINGKSIVLQQNDGSIEGESNSSYAYYTATYTAPKGIIGKAQNLGTLVVYGTYSGKNGAKFNESMQGASIVVAPLPEVPNNADGSLLKVKRDDTNVYNYKTTDSIKTPDMARLPAGTLDYCVKTVTYSSVKYYLTLSGKRLKASDVTVMDNAPIGQNDISIVSCTNSGYDTVLKLRVGAKTPFSIKYNGVSYKEDYEVSSFNCSSVSITFDYTNNASGSISPTSLFSSSSWSDTSVTNVSRNTLTLNLNRAGIFGGVKSYYDSNGYLTFVFNGNSGSLAGSVIVIDPGHGVTSTGKIDPGGVGHITDQYLALNVSKYLASELESRGATVYRLKTESSFYDTEQRPVIAQQYNPDVFISIHGNKASDSKVQGTEAWYFTPYSYPLANSVSSRVSRYFTNNVYASGANKNRGAKQSYYYVTLEQDFASILLEVAFVSNYEEAMAMSTSTHRKGVANAIADGIEDYLER